MLSSSSSLSSRFAYARAVLSTVPHLNGNTELWLPLPLYVDISGENDNDQGHEEYRRRQNEREKKTFRMTPEQGCGRMVASNY